MVPVNIYVIHGVFRSANMISYVNITQLALQQHEWWCLGYRVSTKRNGHHVDQCVCGNLVCRYLYQHPLPTVPNNHSCTTKKQQQIIVTKFIEALTNLPKEYTMKSMNVFNDLQSKQQSSPTRDKHRSETTCHVHHSHVPLKVDVEYCDFANAVWEKAQNPSHIQVLPCSLGQNWQTS